MESERDFGIRECFNGKNVFLTGGTGFIGKVLIEKLLRTVPGIGNIYVFLRSKKGMSTQERMKATFNDKVRNHVLNNIRQNWIDLRKLKH